MATIGKSPQPGHKQGLSAKLSKLGSQVSKYFRQRKVSITKGQKQPSPDYVQEAGKKSIHNRVASPSSKPPKNADKLAEMEEYFLSSLCAGASKVDNEHNRTKVKLAMVKAGMATLVARDPLAIAPRHIGSLSFTAKRKQRVEALIRLPEADFFKLFIQFKLFKLPAEELAKKACVDELSNPKARAIRFNQCRDFFLSGDGYSLLKKLKYKKLKNLNRLLPEDSALQLASNPSIDPIFMEFRKRSNKIKGTDDATIKECLDRQGIDFRPGIAKATFSPREPACQALVILEELYHTYGVMFDCLKMDTMVQGDDQLAVKADSMRKQRQDELVKLIHFVMKENWPEYFSQNSYQQMVLQDPSRKGLTCWNSDSFHPRGGWTG